MWRVSPGVLLSVMSIPYPKYAQISLPKTKTTCPKIRLIKFRKFKLVFPTWICPSFYLTMVWWQEYEGYGLLYRGHFNKSTQSVQYIFHAINPTMPWWNSLYFRWIAPVLFCLLQTLWTWNPERRLRWLLVTYWWACILLVIIPFSEGMWFFLVPVWSQGIFLAILRLYI